MTHYTNLKLVRAKDKMMLLTLSILKNLLACLLSADLSLSMPPTPTPKIIRNSINVREDPDQARHFVGHDLGPNCLQLLSADNTSRQGVKYKNYESEKPYATLSMVIFFLFLK